MDKYDKSENIFALRDRIIKIFVNAHQKEHYESSVGWVPAVDIYETPEMFVLKAEMPEVQERDIAIDIQGDYLRIGGERRLRREGRHYHQVERCYGSFSRSFALTEAVDRSEVNATLQDGILKVSLRKKTPESHGRIDIK